MSINDFKEKIKPFYTLAIILIIASIFFALGRLSAINDRKTPIKITYPNDKNPANLISAVEGEKVQNLGQLEAENTSSEASGEVIGSKSGKKYYFPWCSTVKRIKPENQVHFTSSEEARKAGFLPGGNCKGLK